MDPKKWGAPMWQSLYNIAYVYPGNGDEHMTNKYRSFFISLRDILPCRMCRNNYSKHIEETPIEPYLKDNKTLVEWLTIIQSKVCKMNGKPEIDFKTKFNQIKNQKCPNIFTNVLYYGGTIKSIIILFLGIFIYYKRKVLF